MISKCWGGVFGSYKSTEGRKILARRESYLYKSKILHAKPAASLMWIFRSGDWPELPRHEARFILCHHKAPEVDASVEVSLC